MISLALLAVALVAAVVVIAYNLALYAMPVMVGAAAFNVAHAGGAGVLLSGLAGAAAAIAAVAAVLVLLSFARNPAVRLGSALLFAAPAVIARCVPSRYGYWAIPHPTSTAATARTPSDRTAAGVPRSVATSAATPASADTAMHGQPTCSSCT